MKVLSVFSTVPSIAIGLMCVATAAEAFPTYTPKPRGIPQVRVSGGTRSSLGTSCISNGPNSQLVTLFPVDDLGYTTDNYPAFQWYMPRNNASHVEFNLYEVIDEDNGFYQPVYQTAFVPSSNAGIATLQLTPETGIAPLSSDNYYYWTVDVYCPDETTALLSAEGFVEVFMPEPDLAGALNNSTGVERAAIAAENSLWFDATQALTEQLQSTPNDPQVLESWQILLESIGLENIVTAPLLP
ncbi:MAG: DUF928 domain-containing protein [Cyanobacteria bacterium P01_D01_bin.156]